MQALSDDMTDAARYSLLAERHSLRWALLVRCKFAGPQKIKNRPSVVSNWSFNDQGEHLQRKTKAQNGEKWQPFALKPVTILSPSTE